ncbi:MAG TPA: metallophosphoesterase [Puia sp.]|nr:metallophosphoesterase [Puia sp.]
MPVSRKEFIKLTLKAVCVIGAGNSLRSFASDGFRLPPISDVQLRFAHASDGHYGQIDTNYEFHHDNMVAWLNKEHEKRGTDFSMINGDMFHNDISFLPEVKKKWDRLTMPYYVSHGNHDMIDADSWQKTWNIPWHYAFEKNDTGFLILNTADEKGNYICPDLKWTQEQLEKYQSKKHLIIFMHITPFKWTKGGHECPELVELFSKQSNLKVIFHGHDHDQDNVKEHKDKLYFFDSHIAGNWGTEYRGYRIVEILKNGEILTYQMNANTNQKVNDNSIK